MRSMRITHKPGALALPVLLVSLACAGPALAQGQGNQSTQSGTSPYSLGGYLGFTDRDDADFTYGVEFEYRTQGEWSYGAIVEHTPDVIASRDATLLLGVANFRPASMSRLKLTGGAGVEFTDYASDDIKFRLGAGYDLVVEGPLTITPRVAFDFGEGDENVVLGATAHYRF